MGPQTVSEKLLFLFVLFSHNITGKKTKKSSECSTECGIHQMKLSNQSIIVLFHFLRRLHIKKLPGDNFDTENTHPCILQRSARDGQPSSNSPPGLLVGELSCFCHHLK